MLAAKRVATRYELKERLGEGGMGVVYRAFDTKTNIDVAIKAMRDISDPLAVQLFTKEWSVLAGISHPNIVDVRDVGEIDANGARTPFFVMPLLRGATLAKLIETSSPRLTVDLIVDVMLQVSRGLQAAHERGLIHRDLKPSNIFVLDDDSAKIIDFGVVHLAGGESVSGHKGTWQYMAPELTELQPATPSSDIFALGVICYEALTRRRPFARRTALETVEAIRRYMPPPASEINPAVTALMSMAVHAAMAKRAVHRYASARDFAEALRKAHLGQPIERFDRARILPRLARARVAYGTGDFDFALEIVGELQAEGHVDPDIGILRGQIDDAVKQKRIRGLLDAARSRLDQDEIPLALEKLREALELDPENADAQAMTREVERRRSEFEIEHQLETAQRYIMQGEFAPARKALRESLAGHPGDPRLARLLGELQEKEQESIRARAEKERLYDSAVRAYHKGEISAALEKMERVLALTREAVDPTSNRDTVYEGFCQQVRSDSESQRSAYDDARRALADRDFAKCMAICDRMLAHYPGDALFSALRLEAVEREREEFAAYLSGVHARLESESDLDRRIGILEEATGRYPNEPQFEQSLKLVRERRDLVQSIAAKARKYGEANQFAEALAQWEILRNIHPGFPGLEFEIEHTVQRRERQAEENTRLHLVSQIDCALEARAFRRAVELAQKALTERPHDEEFVGLERLARQGLERSREAWKLLEEAQAAGDNGSYEVQAEALRQAMAIDQQNPAVRAMLASVLLAQSRMVGNYDRCKADELLEEARSLDVSQANLHAPRLRTDDVQRNCKQPSNDLRHAADAAGVRDPASASHRDQAPSTVLFSPSQFLRDFPAESKPPATTGRAVPMVESVARRMNALRPRAMRALETVRQSQLGAALRSPQVMKQLLRAASIVAVVLLVVAAIRIYAKSSVRAASVSPAAPAAATTRVQIKTTPGDASVSVDGQLLKSRLVELQGRSPHPVAISRIGYVPLRRDETPREQWTFSLAAEPTHVRIFTAEQDGEVLLDGRSAGKLTSGALADLQIASDGSTHTLNVRIPAGEVFSASFKANPGTRATLNPIGTKDLVAVSSLGSDATVYSGTADQRLVYRHGAPQSIPVAGLELHDINDPDRQFNLASSPNQSFAIEGGNAPVVSFYLRSNPFLPYAVVSADTRDAHLFVDNVEVPRFPNGNWWFQRPPGAYSMRISAGGFYDYQQKITLAKGDGIALRADLKALPVLSTLSIAGGTPGAEVLVDGQPAGTVDAGGGFTGGQISPGHRIIEMRKPGYEPRQWNADLSAGQTFSVVSREATLTPFGSLDFAVSPASAKVQYQQGDHGFEGRTSGSVSVPARRYHVTATADGYEPAGIDVTVQPGEPTRVALSLTAIHREAPSVKAGPATTMESLFQDPHAFETGAGGMRLTSGGTAWLTPGFSVLNLAVRPGSKRRLQLWIVAGGLSTVVYEFSSRGVSRVSTLGGKRQNVTLLKLSKEPSELPVSFHIEKNRIALEGVVTDEVSSGAADFTSGKIGVSGDANFTIRTN